MTTVDQGHHQCQRVASVHIHHQSDAVDGIGVQQDRKLSLCKAKATTHARLLANKTPTGRFRHARLTASASSSSLPLRDMPQAFEGMTERAKLPVSVNLDLVMGRGVSKRHPGAKSTPSYAGL